MMRREWDRRAQKDALHYIADWRSWEDVATFFESGAQTYESIVAPMLARFHLDPVAASMLEVGSGVGRVTKSFAERFRNVVALDVSGEMLRKGKELLPYPNVRWLQTSGEDLACVRSSSFDLVFSFLVIQHIPVRAVSLALIGDMIRVLKPGGVFIFQFNSRRRGRMNWKGRLAGRTLPLVERTQRTDGLGHRLGAALGSRIDADPLKRTTTWLGAVLEVQDVLPVVWTHGGVAGVVGWGGPDSWCYGIKLA
jgi:SAM-dependent methyltransferase